MVISEKFNSLMRKFKLFCLGYLYNITLVMLNYVKLNLRSNRSNFSPRVQTDLKRTGLISARTQYTHIFTANMYSTIFTDNISMFGLTKTAFTVPTEQNVCARIPGCEVCARSGSAADFNCSALTLDPPPLLYLQQPYP